MHPLATIVDQRYAATKQEQTSSNVTLIVRFFRRFRGGRGAHNGLVGGSSPPGPTTQFPESLITETLREQAALARPVRRTIFNIWSLAGETSRNCRGASRS
jgi:hypothetical protein